MPIMDTEDQENSEATQSNRPRGHRYWLPIGIGLLVGAGIVWVQWRPDLDRNIKAWLSLAAGLLGSVLILLWFVFLSRFRWSFRLSIVALLVLAVVGGRQLVRVDGTTDGRGLPRLVWRWTEPSVAAIGAPTNAPASVTSAVAAPSNAKDVPQFLGPNRDGLMTGVGLGRDWTSSPPRELWRQAIGQGWSAFSVVGGRAYTQEQRGEDECVTCYELVTGKLLWSYANRERFSQWQAGDGPHATPTVDRGRVYAYGAKGHLVCLEAGTGQRVWSRSVLTENQLENLEWGTSAAPLLTEDLVVVTGGQTRGPTVLAYRRSDGEMQWKSGTDRASYASPILATLAGRSAILSFNAGTLTAHDPKTGEEILNQKWGLDGPPKAAQPVVVGGDRVLVTAGYGMGCELFQVSAEADGKLKLTSVWKNSRLKAQFNSVAVREGHFYGLDDGLLACVSVANGERKWKDGRYGSGQSLIVDDLVVVQSESGAVILAEAKPYGFRELGRVAALSSKTWNFPTVAGRYLLARNDREAVCYELPMGESASVGSNSPGPKP
ncbi:MAG: PQQ-binding-like beta-propeller repeat protein [Verrucomicrobiales bacterium]|nr:PQQ-binding-like beta-propeller repeat protein [Verrucomicrobiales bacterium]